MSQPEYLPGATEDPSVQAAARKALELITDGARIGLGSGRAVSAFIAMLGARCSEGMRVSGVATSRATERQARQSGIPLVALEAGGPLDITIDGADEVAPSLDLIKGWGGALVRERIVAAASRRQVIIIGADKLVSRLGERGRLPLEVIPFAKNLVIDAVQALGLHPTLRLDDTLQPLISENGNLTLDCAPAEPIRDESAARELERALLGIVGVVDTGLFLGTAERVLVGYPDGRVDSRVRTQG
ncbi:MAG: ribose-5-phosphate isomerase RpiA [Gemmatimonadota bacterium]